MVLWTTVHFCKSVDANVCFFIQCMMKALFWPVEGHELSKHFCVVLHGSLQMNYINIWNRNDTLFARRHTLNFLVVVPSRIWILLEARSIPRCDVLAEFYIRAENNLFEFFSLNTGYRVGLTVGCLLGVSFYV